LPPSLSIWETEDLKKDRRENKVIIPRRNDDSNSFPSDKANGIAEIKKIPYLHPSVFALDQTKSVRSPNVHSFGEFEYNVNNDLLTWDEHEKLAKVWEGHIASVQNSEENSFLKSLISDGDQYAQYWLGGIFAHDESIGESSWQWVDGVKFGSFNAWEEEPAKINGNRIRLTTDGKWVDVSRILSILHTRWCSDGKRLLNGPAIYKRNKSAQAQSYEPSEGPTPSPSPSPLYYNGYEYLISYTYLDFEGHFNEAKYWGGNLTSAHSEEEFDRILSWIDFSREKVFFLGGMREKSSSSSNVTKWDFHNYPGSIKTNGDNEAVTVLEATGTSVTWKEAHLTLRGGAIYKKYSVGVGPSLTRRPRCLTPGRTKKAIPTIKPRPAIKPRKKETNDDVVLIDISTKSTGVFTNRKVYLTTYTFVPVFVIIFIFL